jgi:hypothetical protein
MVLQYIDDLDPIELKKYVGELIMTIQECSSLKNIHPDAFLFFKQLLQRHPYKETKGVSKIIDIEIKKYALTRKVIGYSDFQIVMKLNDNTSDSISWVKSCNKQDNPVGQKLRWAMRLAIRPQILEFKTQNKKTSCELCNTTKELSVDHIIKFRTLCTDFVDMHQEYPNLFDRNKFAQEVFRKCDAVYEQKWLDYHKTNATLRILCVTCNIGLEEKT